MNPERQPLPLADAVRERQQEQHLDEQRLDALMAMQTAAPSASPSASTRPRWQVRFAAVAGITLAFLLGWWGAPSQMPGQQSTVLARIADEVAANHLQLKPVEIASSDMNELRAFYTELDFRPVETQMLAGADSELVGGRYCAIQGSIAAQLRLRGADGRPRTLYQVRYDADKHGELPDRAAGESGIEFTSRGVSVRIWREKGILFALTGD